MSLIYSPEEDSYLLSDAIYSEVKKLLKKNSNLRCLEIGMGSGIQLLTLKKAGVKKENIYGVDINIDSVKLCQKLGFNSIHSDLFSNVQGRYDLIIFNPPYLPISNNKEDSESQLITTGGKMGSEILNKFLIDSKKYLEKNGKIYILVSSLTQSINFLDYKKKTINSKKIFFEELKTIELSLNKKL